MDDFTMNEMLDFVDYNSERREQEVREQEDLLLFDVILRNPPDA